MLLAQVKPRTLDRRGTLDDPSPVQSLARNQPSRGLPESGEPLRFSKALVLLFTDPGILNRTVAVAPTLSSAWKLYGFGAGLGMGTAEIFGERDLGALYLLGGGVFGRVSGFGEWLAFIALVPVLAGTLTLLHRSPEFTWRTHLVFALHFGAFVGMATAVEFLIMVSLGPAAVGGVASWAMALVAAVYYLLSVIDTYGRSPANLVRGYAAGLAVVAVWVIAVALLAAFTDFTL